MPEWKFLKLKMENCGRADSLQSAKHCRPTVFVYIEAVLNVWADATVLQLLKISVKKKTECITHSVFLCPQNNKKEGNSLFNKVTV